MSSLDRDPDDPAHAAVRAALAETGQGLEPKPGWEAKVWEEIDGAGGDARGSGGTARRRRALWFVGGGGVLAAAAIALLVWRAGGEGREPIVVADASLEIRRSAQVIRGTNAAPGDTAVVRHPAAGGVVWIFRGESTLVLACDAGRLAAPACRRDGDGDGDGVVAELVLDRPGTYHVLTSVVGLPPPATVDEARAALTTTGARFRHDELDVR